MMIRPHGNCVVGAGTSGYGPDPVLRVKAALV
jgi:hypothetical protein